VLPPMMNDRFKEEEFKLNLPREWYAKKSSFENNQLVKRNKPNYTPSSSKDEVLTTTRDTRIPLLVSSYALMSV
ncbi:hypothetical protein THOM_2509, partial [Trachipleistophora hominis]